MAKSFEFYPVRCTQATVSRMDIHEGYVYFAYDSGRIYLDKDGTRYLMSNKAGGGGGAAGGTGILYANGSNTQIIPVDLTEREPVMFYMDLIALEDQAIPEIDNLILNSDGRFFRVLGYDDNTQKITVKLLAVSGSGSGGGGGGSSVEPDVGITWDQDTIARGRVFIYGQSYNAVFTPTTTASGDTSCDVTFTIIDNENGTSTSITKNDLPSGRPFNFDTSILPESTSITLQIVVTSNNSQYNYGLGYQRNIADLRVVRMELEKPVENAYQPLVKSDDLSGQLTLNYRPIGDESLSFLLHTYVDGEEIGTGTQIPADYLNQVVPVTIDRQEHGVHKITFKMSTVISGNTIYSNMIEYQGAWADRNNTKPIIWIGSYDPVIVNYENSYIYYMVFDPVNYSNGMPADVHLQKEGVEVSQVECTYSDDDWLVWDISNLYTAEDNQTLTPNLFTIVCGGSKVNINVTVTTEGARSLGLVAPSNLILNMTTAGRSSNEIKRNRIKFNSTVNPETVTATLNDFNWQNNGWKNSDGVDKNGVDSGSYLSIANGSSLNISLAGNGLILNGAKDYTFECRFRVKNVQEYSTLIKIKPKYFYSVPDDNDPNTFIPTYTITTVGEDEEITGPSLFEEDIIANGYKIGLDKYGNLLMDEANSIKTTESNKGVVCRWLAGNDDSDVGFCIGTQEAYFRTPSGVVNVRYCEDEVINLTMVASKTDRLCYIYLNGILAGAVAMPTGTGSSFTINTPFVFNSNFCDFDLYRFRIYELGLTMPQVIHNYLSDMHSTVLYDQNQITNPLDPTALSYDALVRYNREHPGSVSMPYATWQIEDSTDERLSYKKGNNRPMTIDFVNPPLDEALANEEITPWFYYTHCPSFYAEHIDNNVQGTSSQKYPRRNYKLKFKGYDPKTIPVIWNYTQGPLAGYTLNSDYYFYKDTDELVTVEKVDETTGLTSIVPLTDKNQFDKTTMKKLAKKYHMDTEDFGTNKFTWKIDYMESSETYNTGFANLMGNLVHPLYTKHPLDDLNLGIDTSDMRTTVYGFPVLTFHKYANGKYEYIGKYNMNLDKSSNEYYGFEAENEQPYVEQRTKKVLNKTTNEYEDKVYQPTIAEIAECWELKDNQGNWCSFKYPNEASRRTGFMTLKEGTSGSSAQLELLNHYEYRYSYYGDELDAAYDYTAFTDTNTQVKYTNNGQINTYLYEKHRNFEKLFNWIDSTNTNNATSATLSPAVTYHVASMDLTDTTVNYEILINDPMTVETYTLIGVGDGYDSNRSYFYSTDNGNTLTPYTYTTEEDWLSGLAESRIYTHTYYNNKEDYYVRKNDNFWYYEYTTEEQFQTDIQNGVIYQGLFSGLYKATFTKDTKEYRRQKFYAELEEHLDKEYCLTYYVLTELLLCYDSRGKNLMMATFGPHRAGGEYIWYPIFYDIDTQLGLNNSGAYLWDYDADVTKDNLFSTPTSVLWNNLYDVFYDDIVQKYRVLRGVSNPSSNDARINGSLTYENIAGAYECDPVVFNSYAMKGVRPIVAVGLDEYYKYLAPALQETDYNAGKLYAGYYDTSGTHKYQATPTYVYACQGDKKLTTELLLRNRLNYIDSWWMGGDYRAGVVENQIFLRGNANLATTSDNYLDSNSLSELPAAATQSSATYTLAPYSDDGEKRRLNDYFDARPGFKIKPFLHQYVSYFHDSQPSIPKPYDGSAGQEDGVWTNVDSGKLEAYKTEVDYSQQILYVPGGDYISSLGDLSLVYANAMQIQHGQRLLDLKLGSDIPGYKNPGLTNRNGTDFELTRMPLLKSVNISKLINFTDEMPELVNSAKLQEFRALGSIIERTNFASGAPLRTVHLPATMTTISLVQNQNLTKILTTVPEVVVYNGDGTYTYKDPSTYEGLYIEGVTDYVSTNADSGHKITTLEIVGGGLGYHSYTILKNLYDLKKNATRNETLSIGLTDVQWTPYVAVDKGTEYDNSETYYFLNDHSTYQNYEYVDTATWDKHLTDSLVYTYNTDYTGTEERTITSLSLLDDLIAQYETAKANNRTSQFSNLVDTTDATIPTITGNLYVSNDSRHKIKETDLTNVYAQYFPYLAITARYIQTSNVTKYVQVFEETGITEVIETLRSDETHPLGPTKNAPTKAGYDFIGWSTDAAGNNMFLPYHIDFNTETGSYENMETYLSAYTFEGEDNVLTLYAQFTVHQNVITIYQGNEAIGAAIMAEGTAFINPNYIYDIVDGSIDDTTGHAYRPYKDDSLLAYNKTYKFIGYATRPNSWSFNAQGDLILAEEDAPPAIVENNFSIYGIFKEEDVHNNVLTDSYFYHVETKNLSDIDGLANVLVLDHADELQGKITLPKVVDGKVINVFNEVGSSGANTIVNDTITHIFWEEGSSLQYVGTYACQGWTNLIYFELPNDNMSLRNSAFNSNQGNSKLFLGINDPSILDDWFSRIRILETSALRNIGSNYFSSSATQALQGATIRLPNVKTLYGSCLDGIICNKIVFGTDTLPAGETEKLDYTTFGNSILKNTASTANANSGRRSPVAIEYYDLFGRTVEEVTSGILDRFGLIVQPTSLEVWCGTV